MQELIPNVYPRVASKDGDMEGDFSDQMRQADWNGNALSLFCDHHIISIVSIWF